MDANLRFRTAVVVLALVMSGCSRLRMDSLRPPAKEGTIYVTVDPATTETKYLDGIYWPQGKACGRAYTYWTFMCRPNFELKPLPELSKNGVWAFEVTAVSMKLALPLRTWLPFGCKDKLRAHEAGHIKMCEEIYKNAETVARQCATEMMGRHIQVSGHNNAKSAEEGAFTEATRTLDANYRVKMDAVADGAGVIYDRITNHGMNEVPEEKAIKEAFEEYNKAPPAKP
ncbi:hypothetical protein BH10CYA1_BH10CYA1_60740 [soil metagenome]